MTVPPSSPALVRRRTGRVVAGVAGGMADHLRVDVGWVRAGLVALLAVYGAGALAYALLWIVVRPEPRGTHRVVTDHERRQALSLLVLGAGVGLIAIVAGQAAGWLIGPLGVCALGAAIVWREADGSPTAPGPPPVVARPPAERSRQEPGARWPWPSWSALLRVVVGALFVLAGIGVFLVGNLQLDQVQFAVLAAGATLVGVAVLTVPWWLRLVRDLAEERRARIVTAERAEIAAHLHDSVLQTLALIQRQSDRPRDVLRLARGQERELRTWLYGVGGYHGGSGRTSQAAGLAEAFATAAAEVEDTYAVTVRPVVVGGDRRLDDGLRALVLATREAMVNAAKHAGVEEVSVYAEIVSGRVGDDADDTVHVFVRDRGEGFDPAAVPADRHGLADSVHARMTRHGGTVRLRSMAGEGTEVHLAMPANGAVREETG